MFRRILALGIILLLSFCAFAQTALSSLPPENKAQDSMSVLEGKTLALDIAISTYYELKAMALRLGLSTEGDSEALRSRLYEALKLQPPQAPAPASSVTIEKASGAEYFSIEGSGDNFIRLSGPITMTILTEDDFRHSIKADEIIFNRDKNIIEAKGNALYVRSGGGRADEFAGSTILVDLNSYSGIFIDGAYNLEPSASIKRSLSFAFEKLTRRGSDISVLERAIITACDEDDPHYYIRAKKVWLFENGDWALSGATLYLGVVPVLWLPFFYYPNDEILFHPVFGYRSREGAFVQTTTYLLGEKKKEAEASSSLSMFSRQEEGGAKTVSGIFIKRLQSKAGEEASASDAAASDATLRLLADIYSALGIHVGLSGSYPRFASGSLDFSLGLGLSRSLFLQSNGYYSPFDLSNDNASQWNDSNFLGMDLPFRFGFSGKYSYKKTSGSLRFSIALEAPLYSDPFFEQDFYQRSESSNILSMIDSNKTALSKRTTMTQSLLSNLSWTAGNANASPFLKSVNVSRLAAQMVWKSKSQPTTGLSSPQKRRLAADPRREFFYPESLKPIDAAFALSGSLLSYESKAEKKEPPVADLPGAEKKEGRDFGRQSLNIGWTASGTAVLEEKFNSSAWLYPEDIDASPSYLLAGWRGSAGIDSSATWADRLISVQAGIGMTSQDQWRPYLLDERIAPTSIHPYRLSDFSYRSTAVNGNASLSLSPFASGSPWSASSLRYAIGGTLYRLHYTGLVGSGLDASPGYGETWIGWNSETLSSHALTATLALASPKALAHSLSFSASLPPLLEKYSSTYTLNHKYFRASLNGAVSKASLSAELLPSSLGADLTVGAKPYPVLRSSFSWDFDAAAPLSSISSIEYGWAKASFIARKSKGYSFAGGVWSTDGTEEFRPYETSFTLTPAAGSEAGAGGKQTEAALRFSLRPTLSYTQNLIRFTESTMGVAIDLSLNSADGTSVSFASSSANKSTWRYWPGLFPASPGFDPADFHRSFLTDIAESLSLWDSALLKHSLFKLQSLSIKLAQDLHDWNLEAALGMSPKLLTPDSGRPYYQLDFSFSLAVTWKDIPDIKASTAYRDGSFIE